MAIDRITTPIKDNRELSQAEKVGNLVKGYEQAKLAPEGAVAYTFKPHVERDPRTGRTVDSMGREDLVPQGEVYLLLQAGGSEDQAIHLTSAKTNRIELSWHTLSLE